MAADDTPTRPAARCFLSSQGFVTSRDLVESVLRARSLISRMVTNEAPSDPTGFVYADRVDVNGSPMVVLGPVQIAQLGRVDSLPYSRYLQTRMGQQAGVLPARTYLTLYADTTHKGWEYWPVWSIGMQNINLLLELIPTQLSWMSAITSGLIKPRAQTATWGTVFIDPCDIFDSSARAPRPDYDLVSYIERAAHPPGPRY